MKIDLITGFLGAGKTEVEKSFNDIGDELYGPYLNEHFPAVWSTNEEDGNRASILATDINTYVKSKMAQWISGEANVDEEWDAYLAQLDAYGLEELTEIHRRALGEAQ